MASRSTIEEGTFFNSDTSGPAPFGDRDRQAFANSLDRWLAKRRQNS